MGAFANDVTNLCGIFSSQGHDNVFFGNRPILFQGCESRLVK